MREDPGFVDWFGMFEANERTAAARRCCEAAIGCRALDALGAGDEGVVLVTDRGVAKVFDRWSEADRRAHLGAAMISSPLGRSNHPPPELALARHGGLG